MHAKRQDKGKLSNQNAFESAHKSFSSSTVLSTFHRKLYQAIKWKSLIETHHIKSGRLLKIIFWTFQWICFCHQFNSTFDWLTFNHSFTAIDTFSVIKLSQIYYIELHALYLDWVLKVNDLKTKIKDFKRKTTRFDKKKLRANRQTGQQKDLVGFYLQWSKNQSFTLYVQNTSNVTLVSTKSTQATGLFARMFAIQIRLTLHHYYFTIYLI